MEVPQRIKKIELPYDLAIQLFVINPKEMKYQSLRGSCNAKFIEAVFTRAKTLKLYKCPWMDKDNAGYI